MPDDESKRSLCVIRCSYCRKEMRLVVVEGKQGENDVSWEGRICPGCHHGVPNDIQVTRVRLVERGKCDIS